MARSRTATSSLAAVPFAAVSFAAVSWLALLSVAATGCAAPARSADDAADTREAERATPPGEAEEAAKEPAAPEQAEAPSPDAVTRAPSTEINLDDDDGLDADIAAMSETTQAPEAAKSADAPRDIVYRVTPKGLVIELGGVHLRPEAKPFKDKSGAFGIELVLNVESFDGGQYWLSKPKQGPLSLAGAVEDKAGAVTRFSDERDGDGEEAVVPGAPRVFRQRWPGRAHPKLWGGQTVTLEVGLWGIRGQSGRERPVLRLFVVKMVAGNRSQAVITPPTLDWGS